MVQFSTNDRSGSSSPEEENQFLETLAIQSNGCLRSTMHGVQTIQHYYTIHLFEVTSLANVAYILLMYDLNTC